MGLFCLICENYFESEIYNTIISTVYASFLWENIRGDIYSFKNKRCNKEEVVNMEIHFLKAEHGDAIVIKTMAEGRPFVIVIDGGPESTANDIQRELMDIGHIDLMVLTHFDEDHIMGLIRYVEFFKDGRMPVDRFLCNCAQEIDLVGENSISSTGYENANTLTHYLRKQKMMDENFSWSDTITSTTEPFIQGDLRIDFLSPSTAVLSKLQQEYNDYVIQHPKWIDDDVDDPQIAMINNNPDSTKTIDDLVKTDKPRNVNLWNLASIALLLTAEGKKVLLMGDADADIVADGIEKLIGIGNVIDVDMVKLSHHGSKHNLSNRLLSLIRCNHYVISTCGGAANWCHPDRKTLALILRSPNRDNSKPVYFYFNYPLKTIEQRTGPLLSEEEIKKENCNLIEQNNLVL